MSFRNKTFVLSLVVMLLSLISIFINGIHMGLEFTGGTQMEISFTQAHSLAEIRENLAKVSPNMTIQSLGGSKNLLLRVPNDDREDLQQSMQAALTKNYPDAKLIKSDD